MTKQEYIDAVFSGKAKEISRGEVNDAVFGTYEIVYEFPDGAIVQHRWRDVIKPPHGTYLTAADYKVMVTLLKPPTANNSNLQVNEILYFTPYD